MHQSLVLGNRYLFIFFGMNTEVTLADTIEYLDLHNHSTGFQDIQVKTQLEGISHYFDRSLYILTGERLQDGVDILIFGGFRGDYESIEHDESSAVFKLNLKKEASGFSHSLEKVGVANIGPTS